MLSKKCQKVVKVVKKFDPTFVPPEPSWSLVDQLPAEEKIGKKSSFLPKSSVSKTATFYTPQKNVTFCHVFTT
jgi:hypothetical protein